MRNLLNLKTVASLLVATAVVTMNTGASASGSTNTLTDVGIEAGAQVARIGLSAVVGSGRPACHNVAFNGYYAFDISTVKGKAMLATAQAALLAGKRVSVTGGANCTNIAASGTINVETATVLILLAN
jgi:hypothetical protein